MSRLLLDSLLASPEQIPQFLADAEAADAATLNLPEEDPSLEHAIENRRIALHHGVSRLRAPRHRDQSFRRIVITRSTPS
jgi:hypothetical protein